MLKFHVLLLGLGKAGPLRPGFYALHKVGHGAVHYTGEASYWARSLLRLWASWFIQIHCNVSVRQTALRFLVNYNSAYFPCYQSGWMH